MLCTVSDPPTSRAYLPPCLVAKVGQLGLVRDSQRIDLFKPLVLDPGNVCFQCWKWAGHSLVSWP